MDEARRLHYLAAMGVSVWRLRSAEAASETRQRSDERANAGVTASNAPTATVADEPLTCTSAAAPPSLAGQPPAQLDKAVLASTRSEPGSRTPAAVDGPIDSMDWPALETAVAGCRACRLCERRTNTVFGVGDPNAELMLVGEGPGHDEDIRGEPFVGRAGQLLNRMLTAMELRREQVYIANVVKCRPPNNRNPNPDEAAACRAFLTRQIALVRPKLLVSLGGVSATNLLDTTESVGRLRGRVHHYQPPDSSEPIPLIVTYHPSYYLRPQATADKAKGWQDLQHILRLLRAPA